MPTCACGAALLDECGTASCEVKLAGMERTSRAKRSAIWSLSCYLSACMGSCSRGGHWILWLPTGFLKWHSPVFVLNAQNGFADSESCADQMAAGDKSVLISLPSPGQKDPFFFGLPIYRLQGNMQANCMTCWKLSGLQFHQECRI